MIAGIPKISVVVITYKQEKLIKRAIDSLLSQRDYIFEICVSDDCSPDKTWDILKKYDSKYPGLFKLHQNNPNVGIFKNYEQSWKMPTGDIIYQLEGDDECGEGWFKKVIDYIQSEKIDYKNELFCIYGDYKCIYPNGDSFISVNESVLYNSNALKLALRGIIMNRSACFSAKIMKKYVDCSKGRSHIAEDAQDRQLQIFSEKNYYIHHVGNIYYSFVGVTTDLNDEVLKERAQIRPYAFEVFKKLGVTLDNKDRIFSLEYFPAYELFLSKPSFIRALKLLWLSVKSYDSSIKNDKRKIRHLIFALKRRIPHSTPIHM